MNEQLGTFYIDDLDENRDKEQILHLVSYVNSSNITNSKNSGIINNRTIT